VVETSTPLTRTTATRPVPIATNHPSSPTQKAYIAIEGEKVFTVEEGRALLNAAGAGLDPADPFEAEPAPAPAPAVPDPTVDPTQEPAVPEQVTTDA
jgi:hypothetical protein